MSTTVKTILLLCSTFMALEGFFILLWPDKITTWFKTSSPSRLRLIALLELITGCTLFIYLLLK